MGFNQILQSMTMRFSRSLKCKLLSPVIRCKSNYNALTASNQSLPSPDGAYIASLFPSKLSIRATRSLEITRVISLPEELSASIAWFLWSPSSNRVLVGTSDHVRVYSATNPQFSATITSPTSGNTKATYVAFGASDNEILVFSDFGLKLSIFDLKTSKSVDINSPKLYNPGVAARGFSYRPHTLNLALLTRSGGKDIISIHARDTLDVTRSWVPDTIDSQGISWSADGKWLMVWESASQGHKILVYTADGHLFKAWDGPMQLSDEDAHISLGAGIRLLEWSRTGAFVAIGDYTKRVTLLTAPSFTEFASILHPTVVKPVGSLQVRL